MGTTQIILGAGLWIALVASYLGVLRDSWRNEGVMWTVAVGLLPLVFVPMHFVRARKRASVAIVVFVVSAAALLIFFGPASTQLDSQSAAP